MNPAKLEKRITKVLVSTAMLIGIKKSKVMIVTKKTPPPMPAIVESIPDRRPNKINKEMR